MTESTAILLNVNDSDSIRYLITRTLEVAGYRVLEASTGAAALQLAEELQPDVIILDVKLPDISGYEVCTRLRAREETASLRVLQTSATFITPERKAQGLEGGADAYLAQPFEAEELIATVRSLLRLRRAEQELRQRAEQLAEMDRRKDEFLAMLAHELRNPLAAIQTALAALERTQPEESRSLRMRNIIQRQTRNLTRLVDDLLDVSRLTRGKLTLRKRALDLHAVVEQVVVVMRPMMERRGLDFHVQVAPERLSVEADATRLEQILTNLLDNAMKYTDAGGSISVRLEREHGVAVVGVSDTGIGIPAHQLSEVFDLFVQMEGSLDRARGGLGIGLTLVRMLVELHGGRIEAHSEGMGRGSTFTVRLPLQLEVQSGEEPHGPGARRQSTTWPALADS